MNLLEPAAMGVELLTSSEVAQRLRVSVATLADWRYKSQGPRFVKVGRLVRYRSGDLEAWIELNSPRQWTG